MNRTQWSNQDDCSDNSPKLSENYQNACRLANQYSSIFYRPTRDKKNENDTECRISAADTNTRKKLHRCPSFLEQLVGLFEKLLAC
jgi:hypothetical protein